MIDIRKGALKRVVTIAGVVSGLLLGPAAGRAQSMLSARVGGAFGVNDPATVAVELRIPVRPRIGALASIEGFGSGGACGAIWPSSFRCSYAGVLTQVGAAVAAARSDRAYLEMAGAGGLFARTSFGGHPAALLAGSLGADGGLRPLGRIWLQGSVRGVAIRDPMYRDALRHWPRLAVVSVGLGLAL